MWSSWRKLAMFAAGLGAGSLLFELYLRTAEATPLWRVLPVPEVSLYGPSAETGYAHRPGVRGIWITENRVRVAINEIGLRDAAGRTATKPAEVRRYAVVGDSFVEALQVPQSDTYVALAEKTLDGGRTGRVEVLNVGLAGATPAVLVERARMVAERFSPDGLVVTVSFADLIRPEVDEDSAYPGYVRRADGSAALSHAFREARGYRMRSGPVGRSIYWALDHTRLALVVNNRANVGLVADLPASPPALARQAACSDVYIVAGEQLLSGDGHGFARARLDAVLADLTDIGRRHGVPVAVAVRGLAPPCAEFQARAEQVSQLLSHRIVAADLVALDVDAAVAQVAPGRNVRSFFGFGARIGQGHLSREGHSVHAEVLSRMLTSTFLERR